MAETPHTQAQHQAITHLNGPCLVLAGAGTGKTRVITERIAHLINEHKVEPEQIVALTFTEKAAGEMQGRLDELLPYGVFGVTTATFHGFCNELLRRHSYLVGVDPNARLIGGAEQVSLLRRSLARLPLKRLKPAYNPMRLLRQLAIFIEKCKEERISPSDLSAWATERHRRGDEAEQEQAELYLELAACYAEAVQIYYEHHVLTYADLLVKSLELLQTSALARHEEQDRFHYLLIDEFQDTNTVQAEIAYLLAGERANIFVVGDDDQSIYRFRGANITNIISFRERFPKAPLITLTDNFRSGQAILDAAYQLIQHNNPHRLEAREQIDKRLISHTGQPSTVAHQWYSTGLHEAESVAEQISALLAEDSSLREEDIAILARSHGHLDAFEQELQTLGVNTQRYKQGTFYTQPSVAAALCFLRFLTNPHRNENLFYLLCSPPFSHPITAVRELNIAAKRQSNTLWQQLQEITDEENELAKTARYLAEHLPLLGSKSPSEALRIHILESKWDQQLLQDEQRLAANHLNTLYYEARNFESLQRPALLMQYLQHVDDLIESGEDVLVEAELQEQQSGVSLLTIHASKGLEFRVVFIVSTVMKRFPASERSDVFPVPAELMHTPVDNVRYEEERRLAYVAMTRAKERLILTGSKRYGANKTDSKPSVFIEEALGSFQQSLADQPLRGGLANRVATSQPILQLPFPTTFTASALEAFEDNPAEYQKQHIYRILSDPENSAAAVVGTCVHAALRAYFTAKKTETPFDIAATFTEYWEGTGFEHATQRDDAFTKYLDALRRHIAALPPDFVPLGVEVPITVKLPSGISIIGKIDRVDSLEGGVGIVDYKTGNRDAKPADVKKNLPLAIYALGLEQQGKVVRSMTLNYLARPAEATISVDSRMHQQTIDRLEKLLEALKEAYRTNSFPERNYP